MGSKQENEQILSYYFNEQASPDLRTASYKVRQRLSSSIEGVGWFLQNIPFNEATTYISAFECFIFRLKYFPGDFNQEILGNLFTFLFQHSIEVLAKLPPNAISALCSAQSLLTFLIYPDLCPSLFDLVFQFPEIIKYAFLKSFCECLVLPTPQNVDRFNLIKNSFEQINFTEQIFQQIQMGIQQKSPDAIGALSAFTRWSKNINYLTDSEFLALMFSDTSAELASATMKFIGSISQRSMPDQIKLPLIQNLQIPKRIEFYYTNYLENFEIIQTCAEVVSILGYSLNPPLPEMYQLITVFFNLADKISEKVTSYFRTFASNNPNLCDDIVLKVIQRIIIHFKDNPYETFGNYLSQLLYILLDCFKRKPDSFYNSYSMLLNVIKGSADITQNLGEFSAYIAVTNFMLAAKIPFPDNMINEFFQVAKPLFDIVPPINEHLFFPIYGFIRSFIARDDPTASNFNAEVLKQLHVFSLDPNLPDEVRYHFRLLFLRYVSQKKDKCKNLTDNLEEYLNSRNKELMEISALCLKDIIGGPRAVKSQFCLQYINNVILGENLTVDNITIALCFLRSFEIEHETLKPAQIDTLKQMDIEILTKIAPLCIENDELVANLCKATKGLGETGLQFFISILPNAKGVNSVSAIADTAIIFMDLFASHQNEQEVQNIMKISINLIDVFIELTSQALSMPMKIEDINQVMSMIRPCYDFFERCYSAICQVPESLNKLLVFSKELIVQKYNTPSILLIIFKFLFCAARNNIHFIAAQFTGVSMYFIIAPGFDPNKREWSRLIQGLGELHSMMHKEAYQEFSEGLGATFSSFGLSDFVQKYSVIYEDDKRNHMPLMKKLFIDILAARNSMTW